MMNPVFIVRLSNGPDKLFTDLPVEFQDLDVDGIMGILSVVHKVSKKPT